MINIVSMRKWLSFIRSETAAVAFVFAMSFPMILAGVGLTVDLAQAYNVKMRLGAALDKAALAAGSTTGSAEDIQAQVERFIEANYPDERLGVPFDILVTLGDGTVTVEASSRVDMMFMGFFGIEYLDVYQSVRVRRDLAGVEAVLVLDVTGSMAGNNITALRTAATNFLNTMFSRIDDLEYLKIGIVPFSQSVNVGPYGLGRDPAGAVYGDAFVTRPSYDYYRTASTIQYSTASSTTHWRGCVLDRGTVNDTSDRTDTFTAGNYWGMYRYRINNTNSNPNTGCSRSYIVPLTNNQSRLQTMINGLNADGGTYINLGLIWGLRVISPAFPFQEGVDYNHPDWTKSIILMTDGNNDDTNYTLYGYNNSPSNTSLNSRTTEVCNAIKAQGIRLYTITFQSGISASTRTLMQGCATNSNMYYDAPTNEDLIRVFEQIANELSQLHLEE